jgi:CBS domain-containing protein
MAKESRWCQPLSTWKKYFSRWVTKLEPKDLLETKIFFDFRCAYGDKELVRQLSDNLNNLLPNNPRFFVLLAMDVLQFEPPLGMFGNFIMESTGGYEDTISIKAVMVRIVDFARIYALKHGITEQGTFARLQALLDKGILTVQSHQEMTQAYGYMMRLRIEHQVKLREEGYEADNFIRPNELSAIDQKMLKEIFSQIKHFQMRLSGDFTGASDRL